ncbi:protein kinase domain-containing protein [Candidatus Foliamicus sp.]
MNATRDDKLLATRFRLLRLLGKGGLGEVWLAEDSDSGRELALKKLADEFAESNARQELFRREFSIAQSLVHPAILRPEEYFADEHGHFFTMPLMPGGHFGQCAGEPWEQGVRRLLPLCDALAYAHRKGVVHGDLKPRNILLDESEAARLTDFSAARAGDGNVEAGILRPGGSLAYISPQLLDGRLAEPSDDIYALGCIFHEQFCGYPPYAPDFGEERIRAGILEKPAAPAGMPSLPAALEELVRSMLAPKPERRPPTPQAVRGALEEILGDSSAEVGHTAEIVARTRTVPGDRPFAARQRSGVPVWLTYALGGLLLAGAAGLFLLLPRFVEERTATRPPPPTAAARDEAPKVDLNLLKLQRDAADTAMGEMLRDRNYLAALRPSLWSAGKWEMAVAQEQQADEFYRRREYPDAQLAYRAAAELLGDLREQAPDIGREALAEAQEAIEAGNQAGALGELEKAAILLGETDPAIETARRRVANLPEIMQAVEAARAAARGGSLEEQRQAWQRVLQADPERQSARQALSKVNADLEEQLFGARMSRGHAALGEGDLTAAREAFTAAKQQRPGASAPEEALAALELEERGQRLAELQAAAMAGRFREDWRTAVSSFRGMLEIDTGIVAAQQGLAEAERRVRLDDGLEQTIANAQDLNRDEAWQRGRDLLDQARRIAQPGPRLNKQIERLERVLTVAATPAPVSLRSDGITEVTIFHVGRLGSFDSRVLELRPGAYTAIGRRDGYRDVRRQFTVSPDGLSEPLTLICTEPI